MVNHVDGDGTPPDPLVWSAGALPKRRRVVHAVRCSCLFAWARGYVGGGGGEWITFGPSPVTADDVEVWPYSVGLFVELCYFLRDVALACGWSRPWRWWCIFCGDSHLK